MNDDSDAKVLERLRRAFSDPAVKEALAKATTLAEAHRLLTPIFGGPGAAKEKIEGAQKLMEMGDGDPASIVR